MRYPKILDGLYFSNMNPMGILAQRRIEAAIIKPIYERLVAELPAGLDAALERNLLELIARAAEITGDAKIASRCTEKLRAGKARADSESH